MICISKRFTNGHGIWKTVSTMPLPSKNFVCVATVELRTKVSVQWSKQMPVAGWHLWIWVNVPTFPTWYGSIFTCIPNPIGYHYHILSCDVHYWEVLTLFFFFSFAGPAEFQTSSNVSFVAAFKFVQQQHWEFGSASNQHCLSIFAVTEFKKYVDRRFHSGWHWLRFAQFARSKCRFVRSHYWRRFVSIVQLPATGGRSSC